MMMIIIILKIMIIIMTIMIIVIIIMIIMSIMQMIVDAMMEAVWSPLREDMLEDMKLIPVKLRLSILYKVCKYNDSLFYKMLKYLHKIYRI